MKDFDVDLKSDRISVLEKILLTSESEDEKLEAINQLKGKSDIRAQLAILKALKDESWRIREEAINSVKVSGISSENLKLYLVKLIDDDSPKIREKAIQLLKEIATEELLPYFLNKLHDESDLVRSVAIQAIGKIGNRKIFDTFIKQFHSETSTLTKCSILQLIAGIRDETIIDFLIKVLQNESERGEVRSEAARTLAKSGSPKAFISIFSILNDEIVENRISTGFISFSPVYLKIELIKSLALNNEEKTVDFLVQLYNTEFQKKIFQPSKLKLFDPLTYEFKHLDNSTKMLLIIIKTLGELGHKKAIPFLLNTLNSVYYAIRIQSVAALFQFNDVSVNERLISIIRDKNEDHQFKEMMLVVMYSINEEGFMNLGLSMDRISLPLYRKFIHEFFK